jgi:hypothetical protein
VFHPPARNQVVLKLGPILQPGDTDQVGKLVILSQHDRSLVTEVPVQLEDEGSFDQIKGSQPDRIHC